MGSKYTLVSLVTARSSMDELLQAGEELVLQGLLEGEFHSFPTVEHFDLCRN